MAECLVPSPDPLVEAAAPPPNAKFALHRDALAQQRRRSRKSRGGGGQVASRLPPAEEGLSQTDRERSRAICGIDASRLISPRGESLGLGHTSADSAPPMGNHHTQPRMVAAAKADGRGERRPPDQVSAGRDEKPEPEDAPLPWAALLSLTFAQLASALILTSAFPIVGPMASQLLQRPIDEVGAAAGVLGASFMFGRVLTSSFWGERSRFRGPARPRAAMRLLRLSFDAVSPAAAPQAGFRTASEGSPSSSSERSGPCFPTLCSPSRLLTRWP